eukprot:1720304-Rhodomonas_salina.1
MANATIPAPLARLLDGAETTGPQRFAVATVDTASQNLMFRFWVNWDCKLEAIEMPRKCTVTELAEQTKRCDFLPDSFSKECEFRFSLIPQNDWVG